MFIKQVPDTNDVKWTENNNIDRSKMECIMNPVDKQALEAALRIKEYMDASVTAVTMGPEKAKNILEEAIAMGVDDAFLLCDSKFAGSDTLATSKILSSAIKELLPDTDLIICGQSAIDGETGQTGFCTAARLNMPCYGNVSEITEITDNYITVVSDTDKNKITCKMQLPAFICINNYIFKPRLPLITGYIKAQNYNYKIYNIYDLNLRENETGFKGSPTYVSKVFKCEDVRHGIIYDSNSIAISEIYKEIKKVL